MLPLVLVVHAYAIPSLPAYYLLCYYGPVEARLNIEAVGCINGIEFHEGGFTSCIRAVSEYLGARLPFDIQNQTF